MFCFCGALITGEDVTVDRMMSDIGGGVNVGVNGSESAESFTIGEISAGFSCFWSPAL